MTSEINNENPESAGSTSSVLKPGTTTSADSSSSTVSLPRKYRFGFFLPQNEAQKRYFYVTAFAIFSVALARYFEGPPVAFTFLVGAVLGLFFIGGESKRGWRAMPVIGIVILCYLLFAPLLVPIGFQTSSLILRTFHFEPMTIILSISVLVYLAAQYRYYSVCRRIFPNETIGKEPAAKPNYFRNVSKIDRNEIIRMVVIAVVCVIGAELVWFFANELYFEPILSTLIRQAGPVGMEQKFQSQSVYTWLSRLILVVAFFVVIVVASQFAFKMWRLQQITPLQGEAILADAGWSANHKEHRRNELWRAWAREKAKKKSKEIVKKQANRRNK
jgi:hypothetical protein